MSMKFEFKPVDEVQIPEGSWWFPVMYGERVYGEASASDGHWEGEIPTKVLTINGHPVCWEV